VGDVCDRDLSIGAGWSFNEYRGPGFNRLFDQWAFVSGKPMFLGEYGIDAYSTTLGAEDQATHAQVVKGLWDEIARNLSADDASRVALGGALFEWNDEWWKAGNDFGQDAQVGWTPEGFPDQAASEEWWGIVRLNRTARQLYTTLTSAFASGYVPPAATQTRVYRAVSQLGYAKLWENGSQMYIGRGASIDGGRGFNIAAINPSTGRLYDHPQAQFDGIQRFDTWASRSLGTAGLLMLDYLNSLPNGTILLIAVADEAGLNNFSSCTFQNLTWVTDVRNAMQALGSTQLNSYCYNYNWAMITIKGQGVALHEALTHYNTSGGAQTQATIQLP
jgi:hypothetical protein